MTVSAFNKQQKTYEEHGYCEGRFDQQWAIDELKNLCLEQIRTSFGETVPLEQYHCLVADEQQHRDFHFQLAKKVADSALHKKLVEDNAEHYQQLVGMDLDIQAEPYLRISRPHVSEDNIGLHRDTFYGNSAYEVSCIVPLVDFEQGAAVNVIPDSQQLGPLAFEQVDHDTIVKGSKQNQIGFLYSTKVIKNLDRSKIHGPLLKIGEYMMFSLGMIHGQEKNTSAITRWSIDFRFKNRFVPCSKNLKAGYYQSLCLSPAARLGNQYYQHNPLEVRDLKGHSFDLE